MATEPFIQYSKLLTLPRAEVPVTAWPSKPGSSVVRVVVGHGQLQAVPAAYLLCYCPSVSAEETDVFRSLFVDLYADFNAHVT